ncbi:MAG TPA: DapH/DapD/GlmU-related protein, partial [Rhodocyclaceae bacterium]|nr:DapH/DapD/GlmU-related protein [Rhodocyclaceae bacterium]
AQERPEHLHVAHPVLGGGRRGAALLPVVHYLAIIGRPVAICAGTVLMAGVVVNPEPRIGSHAIVNTGASVDHDCVIGDGVHVAPGCRICGEAAVGDGALLGVGAVVLPGCRVGAGAVVGAGATVTADVADGMVVVGTPARPRGCA